MKQIPLDLVLDTDISMVWSGAMETNQGNQKGFTLGELLVVIAIMTILVAVAVGAFTGLIGSGKSESAKFEKESVQSAVESYLAVSGTTAVTARSGAAVITSSDSDAPFSSYLRRLPTNYQYTWTATGSVTQYGAPATGGGGGASWANAYSNQFDGVNEYVNCGNGGGLDAVFTSITVGAWIKTSDATPANGDAIVSKGSSSGSNNFDLNLEPDGRVRFWFSSTNLAYSGSSLSDNTWHHIVGVWNGTQTTVYLDGVAGASIANTPTVSASGNPVLISSWNQSANWWFSGNVDEVSIWNTALNQAGVTELYNSGIPDNLADHSAYSDLVSWWRMGDDDSYPTLTDNKGSNDGTMTNMESGDVEADTP